MNDQKIFQKKNLNKKKTSVLSVWKVDYIDYKNLRLLRKFISVFERILPRRVTGNSAKHQKMLEQAIKRARFMSLLPYTSKHRPPEGKRMY
jgi:small subunit ribosomal protein S18